jgi:hypothetical protein
LDSEVGLEFYDLVDADFDHGLTAEEFEEDPDPRTAWHHTIDHAFQPVEGAAGDSHFVARFDFVPDHAQFFVAEHGTEFLDYWIGNGWPTGSEMNDASDPGGVMDQPQRGSPVEPGEDIVGEQGFCHPDRAAAGGAAESDTRAEDLGVQVLTEVGCGDVFMFRLGPDAEPSRAGRFARRTRDNGLDLVCIAHEIRVHGRGREVKRKVRRPPGIAPRRSCACDWGF